MTPAVKFRSLRSRADRQLGIHKPNHGGSSQGRRDDRLTHDRSLASDPHGCGECHYDVGNMIDHAIAAFVNPFTSDGAVEPSGILWFKSKAQSVVETLYLRIGPWLILCANLSSNSVLSFLAFRQFKIKKPWVFRALSFYTDWLCSEQL
jgi:hypothetical protein